MLKKVVLCTALILITSGCAHTTNRRAISTGDILCKIGESVCDMFSESEIDHWRRTNRKNLNSRRQWQAENSF